MDPKTNLSLVKVVIVTTTREFEELALGQYMADKTLLNRRAKATRREDVPQSFHKAFTVTSIYQQAHCPISEILLATM